MKIAAASVSMDAACTYREVEEWKSTFGPMNDATNPASVDDFGVRLSQSIAISTFKQIISQSAVGKAGGGCRLLPLEADGVKNILSQFTEQLIGRPVAIGEVQGNLTTPMLMPGSFEGTHSSLSIQRAEFTSSIIYHQEEKLLFSAQGQVLTVDGREISFNFGLSMERSTVVTESIAMNLTMFVDPLVLQFDAGAPLLSDTVFDFDLDSDGAKEQLACPGRGCGFLAFDRNSDGCINNGSELFGPATGSGFGELANQDLDANGWIDENDPIFDKLSIWSFDENGCHVLHSLRDAGVGAISVTNAGSKFQLEGADGRIIGRVKADGIFLTETGEVRSLQEVDLATVGNESAKNLGELTSGKEQLEGVLLALKNIIQMQQFRLKMRLAEQRLQGTTHKAERRQWLIDWLQNRSEWHAAMTNDRKKGDEGFIVGTV